MGLKAKLGVTDWTGARSPGGGGVEPTMMWRRRVGRRRMGKTARTRVERTHVKLNVNTSGIMYPS